MGKDILAAHSRGGFPSTTPSAAAASSGVVEFGWGEDKNAKLSGRRKKLQKKIKPGSFGAGGRRLAGGNDCSLRCIFCTLTRDGC